MPATDNDIFAMPADIDPDLWEKIRDEPEVKLYQRAMSGDAAALIELLAALGWPCP